MAASSSSPEPAGSWARARLSPKMSSSGKAGLGWSAQTSDEASREALGGASSSPCPPSESEPVGLSSEHCVTATLNRRLSSFLGSKRQKLQLSGFSRASRACLGPKQTTQSWWRSLAAIRAPHAAGQAREKLSPDDAVGLDRDIAREKSVASSRVVERAFSDWLTSAQALSILFQLDTEQIENDDKTLTNKRCVLLHLSMAVVIRLQGLPIVAGTMDIRHFFSGLTIPDGGVHIVGGEHGEAFIVFATDEDARLGMMRTGGSIKGSKVSLLLSSKTEMQNMIELSRRRFETGSAEVATGNGSRPGPPVSTGGSGRGNLATTAQGFSNTTSTTATTAVSTHEPFGINNDNGNVILELCTSPNTSLAHHANSTTDAPHARTPTSIHITTVTECEVRDFFQGLGIESVRLLKDHMGRNNGRALVKFFSPQESFEALKRNAGLIGQRYVEVSPATERQWRESAGQSKAGGDSEHNRNRRRSANSPPPSGRERARSRSPHKLEFCVYLKGLPYEAENKQIFEFFKNLDIVEDSIYIAYGPNGRATGEGFVEFRNENDYKVALGCHMQYMGSRFIQVHPITKKNMYEKIDTIRKRMQGSQGDQKNSSGGGKSAKNCAHITNIPYNVTKKDVRLFLDGIQLFEESLKVLVDGNGNGLGQAIVQFKSDEDALKAERLHRQKLNGRDAFVHLVTFDQMKEVERNPPPQAKRGQKSLGNSHAHTHAHAHAQPQAQVPQVPHAFPGMTGDEFSFLRNAVGTLGNGPPFVNPFVAPGNGLAGPPPLPPLGAALGDVPLGLPPPMVGGPLPGPVLEHPGFRPSAPSGFGAPEPLRGIPSFDNGSSRKAIGQNHGGSQGQRPATENLRGPTSGPALFKTSGQ
ncbi:RNA-binding protein [Pimephales promelas]|nr:RNA-binding protein [Pimephales promelas]